MTRAVIKLIKEGEDDKYFYSHYDGYPSYMVGEIIKNVRYKESYDDVVNILSHRFTEIGSIPGDVDYIYVLNLDNRIINSHDSRWGITHHAGLLRMDKIDDPIPNISIEF